MNGGFFERPVLNSPYEQPRRHWALDEEGRPTGLIVEGRRPSQLITPVPPARSRRTRGRPGREQRELVFDEGRGLSNEEQAYDPTPIVNEIRGHVESWRRLPDPVGSGVTPVTARLLRHWRHHPFTAYRPFFCRIEAVETAIRLAEVAHDRLCFARLKGRTPCMQCGFGNARKPASHGHHCRALARSLPSSRPCSSSSWPTARAVSYTDLGGGRLEG